MTKPVILVIHGVASKPNRKLTHAKDVKNLVDRELKRKHMKLDYDVAAYQYEDLNSSSNTSKLASLLLDALKVKSPITSNVMQTAFSLINDVVIAASNSPIARQIIGELKDKIMTFYGKQKVIVLAHSLGSVYAIQAINELIRSGHFDGSNRYHWPVFSLVTIGSPLGVAINLPGNLEIFPYFPLEKVASQHTTGTFRWHNLYHLSDPIVTGQIFGNFKTTTSKTSPLERRYQTDAGNSNWLIRHYHIGTGEKWLLAHIAYWNDPSLGHLLLNEIA